MESTDKRADRFSIVTPHIVALFSCSNTDVKALAGNDDVVYMKQASPTSFVIAAP